jgi:hypothetical protein
MDHLYFLLNSDRSKKPFSSLILSVLPALAKKSFLNVGEQCPEEQGTVNIVIKNGPGETGLTSSSNTVYTENRHM